MSSDEIEEELAKNVGEKGPSTSGSSGSSQAKKLKGTLGKKIQPSNRG